MQITVITSWFTDVIGGSGTGVFFNSLVSGLRDRGHDLELISPVLREKDYVNITLERFLFNSQLPMDPRIQKADVLIGFDYDGYGIDPRNRPPMITSAHAVYGDVVEWEREPVRTMVQSQAYFDRVAMHRADHVTIGSEYARGRLMALYGLPPEKVTTISHGMATPHWLSLAAAMPRIEHDHPILLAVGKMYPRKRLDILLKAMPGLIDKHPTIELRVVGDGLEFERTRALSRELGIDAHVTWLGHIDNDEAFAREWRRADVFCHPSLQETFGYVYLEAMLLGKAVVASRASAAPEVIGDAGLLVEPEDSEAFGAAVHHLLMDPFLRNALEDSARKRAAWFSQRRMIDGYMAVINQVMELRGLGRIYSLGNGHLRLRVPSKS